jgi:hypothetical protein
MISSHFSSGRPSPLLMEKQTYLEPFVFVEAVDCLADIVREREIRERRREAEDTPIDPFSLSM